MNNVEYQCQCHDVGVKVLTFKFLLNEKYVVWDIKC